MNITEFLTISAAIVPDRPGMVFEDRSTTFEQLQTRVNKLANGMADLGVGAEDRVAFLHVNTDHYIEALFATSKLDAVFVPLNFRARGEELSYMINDSTPKVLFVGPRYVDMVKSFADGIES
ncbi:MAG TPA: AMP-binding protein, partial [SAR202 cluster bacterium]|nr:AMP-binding protein [SAR202 cluster bacterium]